MSLKRIEKFLLNDDIDPDNVQHDPTIGNVIHVIILKIVGLIDCQRSAAVM